MWPVCTRRGVTPGSLPPGPLPPCLAAVCELLIRRLLAVVVTSRSSVPAGTVLWRRTGMRPAFLEAPILEAFLPREEFRSFLRGLFPANRHLWEPQVAGAGESLLPSLS